MDSNENPWLVETLEEFLFYNCPECNDKISHSKDEFIDHAWYNHPKSQMTLIGKYKILPLKSRTTYFRLFFLCVSY